MKKFDVNGDFYDLYFKDVRVVDINGYIYVGNVRNVIRADENDSGEESIAILTSRETRTGIELERTEIVSIEIFE